MTINQQFNFQGHTYTIDMIGPRQTLLSRDDGYWQLVYTSDLEEFLNV